ncbi:IclR family transcriptional regulator [Bariatricus sp. SGI.154]|uniref:IclR family transcriptional regulator n=1 Tax=Bariatricus sp. SGI.154 TaxID=3420549 RepID=UPI003CFDDA69
MPTNEHRPTTRVLDILELLAEMQSGMSLTEIAEAISAPKSSILPLMHTLASRKFIFYDKDTQKYTIGVAAFSVGSSYIQQMSSMQFIQSEMQHLTASCNETCQLGIRDDESVLYLAKVDSPEPLRLISYVGKRLPLYCTALGKSLLCDSTLDELTQLYPNGLKAYTPNTITDIQVLYDQLQQIKQGKIAQECEEVNLNLKCISTPLRKNSKIVAALSVSIPVFRSTAEKEEQIIKLLHEKRQIIETYFLNYNIDPDTLSL